MNTKKRYAILHRMKAKDPYPRTELIYNSPFELLIAVLLSAQTTDVIVNKTTKSLFSVANNPKDLMALGIDNVKKYIKSVGLFNIKATNIIKICQILLEQHKGEVPQDRLSLESLPGVGSKTANVVLNIAFGWPTIAVDTHTFRVANRTCFAISKNTKIMEKKLLHLVPEKFKLNFNHWFILHGRYICLARKPKCNFCLIQDLCEYDLKTYYSN